MKSFFEWPMDGQITFVLIIFSLLCLFCADFFNRPASYQAQKNGDHFIMRPLPSTFVMVLGLFCMVVALTYGLSKTGYCPKMTFSENRQNQFIGLLLIIAFVAGFLYYIYMVFLLRYAFNSEEFIIKSPVKGMQRYFWKDITDIGVSGGYAYFKLGKKKIGLLRLRSGEMQIINLIDSKIMDLTNPLFPVFNEEEVKKSLLGKSILVNILCCNETMGVDLLGTGIGTVDSYEDNFVSITLKNGKYLKASTNIRSLAAMSGEPEFEGRWYVANPGDAPDL